MPNFSEDLNPQQQQALSAGLGPILVVAGPGSGKTRVLTHRLAHVIQELGVDPYNIWAVTFTNKAAREMGKRVESLLGGHQRGLTLGTFHATCARLLRVEAQHLPFDQNFVIFDDDDQQALVRSAIKELNIDDKYHRPRAVHSAISNAKNELLFPEDLPQGSYREQVVAQVYQRYQQMLISSNALDFDDLLLWTTLLLDDKKEVREKYARRFEHVLVDEFQDTNQAQYTLLKHLSSFHRNIFVVGDTDQSIYRWRGADYRNVERFQNDFPDAQVILLEENYRSTQRILDASMAVIERNPHRTHKELFTQRGRGNKLVFHEAVNEDAAADYVVKDISTRVAAEKRHPGEFAIMYRTNAQSRLLEEAFLHAGLPYKLVGAQRFYGRREVKDVLGYLRVALNSQDEASLGRVINTPTRRIGVKAQARLKALAQKHQSNSGAMLLLLAQDPGEKLFDELPALTRKSLLAFASKFSRWVAMAAEASPLELMDQILADTDYQSYIQDGGEEEGLDRWDNVLELQRLASEFKEQGLTAFLESVALVSDQDQVEEDAQVPTLLTLHTAKGLEFPVVYIAGLDEGTLPHSRSMDDPEEMAEERRLLYVGMTRAKDQLVLIHDQFRNNFGYSEPTDPSRFLDDLPDELVEGGTRIGVRQPARLDSWEPAKTTKVAAIEQKYEPGMNVRHPSWGEGMVLNSNIQDDDEVIDIFFEEVGLKKVVAAFAKLEVVDK
jgi:DNA helicase-2/ATP-dependent DNA helicase PcrA